MALAQEPCFAQATTAVPCDGGLQFKIGGNDFIACKLKLVLHIDIIKKDWAVFIDTYFSDTNRRPC